jgi:hypothetical protein
MNSWHTWASFAKRKRKFEGKCRPIGIQNFVGYIIRKQSFCRQLFNKSLFFGVTHTHTHTLKHLFLRMSSEICFIVGIIFTAIPFQHTHIVSNARMFLALACDNQQHSLHDKHPPFVIQQHDHVTWIDFTVLSSYYYICLVQEMNFLCSQLIAFYVPSYHYYFYSSGCTTAAWWCTKSCQIFVMIFLCFDIQSARPVQIFQRIALLLFSDWYSTHQVTRCLKSRRRHHEHKTPWNLISFISPGQNKFITAVRIEHVNIPTHPFTRWIWLMWLQVLLSN